MIEKIYFFLQILGCICAGVNLIIAYVYVIEQKTEQIKYIKRGILISEITLAIYCIICVLDLFVPRSNLKLDTFLVISFWVCLVIEIIRLKMQEKEDEEDNNKDERKSK